ncbi:MAG: hypothetical protein KC983_11355, partial [Phycisphaerales bacterium]|nr:hypothetical protein [Phycisphaerales bacterium]
MAAGLDGMVMDMWMEVASEEVRNPRYTTADQEQQKHQNVRRCMPTETHELTLGGSDRIRKQFFAGTSPPGGPSAVAARIFVVRHRRT